MFQARINFLSLVGVHTTSIHGSCPIKLSGRFPRLKLSVSQLFSYNAGQLPQLSQGAINDC